MNNFYDVDFTDEVDLSEYKYKEISPIDQDLEKLKKSIEFLPEVLKIKEKINDLELQQKKDKREKLIKEEKLIKDRESGIKNRVESSKHKLEVCNLPKKYRNDLIEDMTSMFDYSLEEKERELTEKLEQVSFRFDNDDYKVLVTVTENNQEFYPEFPIGEHWIHISSKLISPRDRDKQLLEQKNKDELEKENLMDNLEDLLKLKDDPEKYLDRLTIFMKENLQQFKDCIPFMEDDIINLPELRHGYGVSCEFCKSDTHENLNICMNTKSELVDLSNGEELASRCPYYEYKFRFLEG